jgi:hypothetical protein
VAVSLRKQNAMGGFIFYLSMRDFNSEPILFIEMHSISCGNSEKFALRHQSKTKEFAD